VGTGRSREADLIHVERFGAVDIRHRYRDEFDLPVILAKVVSGPDI